MSKAYKEYFENNPTATKEEALLALSPEYNDGRTKQS